MSNTIIALVSSAKGFRAFGTASFASEDIVWNPVTSCTVSFTTITSTADFGNSNGASSKRIDNSGAAQRGVFSIKTGNVSSYGSTGLFSDNAGRVPSIYQSWYGFMLHNDNTVTLRDKDTSLAPFFTFNRATDTLKLELWADSVRFFVNTTEIYRSTLPAADLFYYGGVLMTNSGESWMDGKIGGVLSPH